MVQHCCRWYMTRMRQCQTFDNKCLHYDGVYEDLGHRTSLHTQCDRHKHNDY